MGVECSALQLKKAKDYIDKLCSIKIDNSHASVLQAILPKKMNIFSDDSYVLLINIIFSMQLPLKHKMDEVFKLFDIDHKNCINKDELAAMLSYLYRAYQYYKQKHYTYDDAQQYIQANFTTLLQKSHITPSQFYSAIKKSKAIMEATSQLEFNSTNDELVFYLFKEVQTNVYRYQLMQNEAKIAPSSVVL